MVTTDTSDIRIDKFLWAVRLYKTRSLAAEACKKGKIIINNVQVKSSRIVVRNEIIIVKKLPVVYSYRVKDITGNRIAAKLFADFIEDLTPEEEKFKLKLAEIPGFGHREKGTGRPTKKERRVIDKFSN